MTPWRRSHGPDNLQPSMLQRRNERYLLNSRLNATIREDQGETRVQTRALDISESGIGALSRRGWDIGVHVDLEVLLPIPSVHLEIKAVVRHWTGLRCGLEFEDVSPEQQKVLRDVCKSLAALPLRPGTSRSLS